MATQCAVFGARGWEEEGERQRKEREEGKRKKKEEDEEISFAGAKVFHQVTSQHDLVSQQFYNSDQFVIGYNELQCRWGSQGASTTYSSRPRLDTPAHHPHLHSPSPHPDTHRRPLPLPLDSPFSPTISTQSSPTSPPSPSTLHLPLHSPFSPHTQSSPTTSIQSSPTSSPSPSTPYPDPQYKEHLPLLPKACCGREGQAGGRGCEDKECQRPNRLLGVIRELIHEALTHAHLRPRRGCHEPLNSEAQVAILESELEAYRAMSQAKKEAADLLKHELMAVLYERVLAQEEQEHIRRQLERDISHLQNQLYHQTTTAHHHLAHLSTQLHRALAEKQLLQRQLSPHPRHHPPDAKVVSIVHAGRKIQTTDVTRPYTRRKSY